MSYTEIYKKTEKHDWVVEHVSTTLTLVYGTWDGKVHPEKGLGLIYKVDYGGTVGGHVAGGPKEVLGNTDMDLWRDGKNYVHLTISDFVETPTHASMHVKIKVHYGALGTKTIFDKTLSGNLPKIWSFEHLLEAIAAEAEKLAPVG